MTDARVVVLSLSPALDRTLRVDSLRRGAVHRPGWTDERAGGKGANVVRTLRRHGVPAVLVAALGGVHGDAVRSLAQAEGLELVEVADTTPTRVCTTVVDDGAVTSFYERPGPMSTDMWAALLGAVRDLLPASVVVIAGSVPTGLPEGALVDLVGAARLASTPVWADVSAPALTELSRQGAVVWPNLFEAREALGAAAGVEPVHGAGDGIGAGSDAAGALVALGASAAIVSCGADGAAIAVADGSTAQVLAVPVTVVNPVGAGDVLLGATLAHLHARSGNVASLDDLGEAVTHGVKAASLACRTAAAADLP